MGETRIGAMLPQRLPPSPWPGDLEEARTMFAGLGGELRDKRLAREKDGLGEEPVELGEREEGHPAREEGVELRTDSPSASSSVDESTIRLRACLSANAAAHFSVGRGAEVLQHHACPSPVPQPRKEEAANEAEAALLHHNLTALPSRCAASWRKRVVETFKVRGTP